MLASKKKSFFCFLLNTWQIISARLLFSNLKAFFFECVQYALKYFLFNLINYCWEIHFRKFEFFSKTIQRKKLSRYISEIMHIMKTSSTYSVVRRIGIFKFPPFVRVCVCVCGVCVYAYISTFVYVWNLP